MTKTSKDFGDKEHILNYSCQRYQLSRPNKVGAVMDLIRQCQPKSFEQWEQWYFENAKTDSKTPTNITKESLEELGERLYTKITEFIIPQWQKAFDELTLQDCIDYIYNLTIQRTYDGYVREKSVVNDGLCKKFPQVNFEETTPLLDHAGDIDYIAKINNKAFGIQIKPITANANFGGYSLTERMKESFKNFRQQFGGNVFVVTSFKGEIANTEVLREIEAEIERLKSL